MVDYGTHRSFWFTELPDLASSPALSGKQRADVVVIGGGFAGLATAINLRQLAPSIRVTLLEAEHIGFGASGRNSGYVWPRVTTYGYLKHLFGLSRTREVYSYAARSCRYVEELISEFSLDSEYRKPGAICAAIEPRYAAEMRAQLSFLRDLGGVRELREMTRHEVRAEIDSPMLHEGFFDPDIGYIQPAKHARGLKRVALGLGVVIHEMSPAIGISCGPHRVEITTPGGQLVADRIVLATNAYTNSLIGLNELGVRRHQYPGYVHCEITDVLSERSWQVSGWRAACGLITAGPITHFMHRTSDSRIHWGCDVYFDIPRPAQMGPEYLPDYSKIMGQHLDQYFPALAPVRPVHQWGGPVALTPDGLPHLGFVKSERVLLAAGCNGNGVAMAHLNGRTAAELLLGKQTEATTAWFVKRRPWRWPGRLVAFLSLDLLTRCLRFSARRRLATCATPFHPPYSPLPDSSRQGARHQSEL